MPSDGTAQQYVSHPGSENVAWKGIQDLWQGNLLCDVTLIAGEKSFEAHRCYLASCSPYFLSMFTGAFRERTEKKVEIQGVPGKGLEDVLTYMYTGKVELNQDNVKDILEVSSHLQVTDLQKICDDYLKKYISADNCLQFFYLTELYSLQETKITILDYMQNNFATVAEKAGFNSINVDLLCDFLESDSLNIESELIVFKSAVNWLKKEPERLSHTKRVLKCVRFGLMSSEDMKEVYEPGGFMMEESCGEFLKAALDYHMNEYGKPTFQRELSSLRNYVDSIVIYGGTCKPLQSDEILATQIAPTGLMNYSHLGELKEMGFGTQMVVLNNFLFVVGGEKNPSNSGRIVVNSAFRYNPRDCKWLQLSSMSTARSLFALVALSGCLYAVGGQSRDKSSLTCVEKYHVKDNVWSPVKNLNHGVRGHAGCELNGQVFISGGSCKHTCRSTNLQSYDPSRDSWQTHAAMNHARVYHTMVSVGNSLYVFGGYHKNTSKVDTLQTEMYSLDADQWTTLSPVPLGHCYAGCVQHCSDICIIGGYSWDRKQGLNKIQRYNVATDEWTVLECTIPVPAFCLAAACLKLPRHVYQADVISP